MNDAEDKWVENGTDSVSESFIWRIVKEEKYHFSNDATGLVKSVVLD